MKHAAAHHRCKGRRLARLAGLLLGCTGLSLPAAALYKVVGADGKVTYTDRPAAQQAAKVVPLADASPKGDGRPGLPAALRQTAERFPVTLYVAAGCGPPCDSARQFLQKRGIPYSERQVATQSDAETLERLSGGREAPTLAVGKQVLRGFTQTLWQQYLDLAGYPAESRLPAGYAPPAPRPVNERSDIAAPTAASAPAVAPATAAPSATRSGAGGIRF